jgi:flagellar assembly protein FliH
MISQCEVSEVMDWAEERTVVPLEFHELRAIDEIVEATPFADSERSWKGQVAALETKLLLEKESTQVLVDAARREATAQAREEILSEMERRIDSERAKVAKAITEFGLERERYFAGVEAEVVSLALAIARRVIHREALLDPLLLQSAVRVALEKVAGESNVTLRVPENQMERWHNAFAAERGDDAITVIADKRLEPEELVLQTSVGKVELGISAQLSEIERGFFDLLKKRPAR